MRKKTMIGALVIFLVALLLFLAANLTVRRAAKGRIFADANACPVNHVGIVLGCSKHLMSGEVNPHYQHRIAATFELYSRGKIRHVLISGDGRRSSYNEPREMKDDLVALGVPESAMTLDEAGFATLDTVVRAREVFGVEKATLVTQRYHLPRALYIASAKGLDAIGYVAPEPNLRHLWMTQVREWLARCSTIGDLYLWNRRAESLENGKPIAKGDSE